MSSISTGGCGPRPITSDVTRHEAVTRLSRPATWQSSGWETIKLIVNDYPFGPEKIVGLVVSYLKLLFTTEPVDNTMDVLRNNLTRKHFSENIMTIFIFWKLYPQNCFYQCRMKMFWIFLWTSQMDGMETDRFSIGFKCDTFVSGLLRTNVFVRRTNLFRWN